MNEEGLVKISVPVEDGDTWIAETVWAEPLGDSLYRVRNLLWLVDDLHADDVVRCEEREAELPQMVEVVERSGHDTLRLVFTDKASDELRAEVLSRLYTSLGNYERSSEDGWMFDVTPGSDLASAEAYLGSLQQARYLA